MTTTLSTASPSSLLQLSGLGMWYGAHTFDQHSWEQTCQQARFWGMSIVHPKLADGPNLWYDGPGLAMLKQVADAHSLRVVPYHFCYGNTVGSSAEKEASICALLGNIYGSVSPDMEDKWFNQAAWATDFGRVVRANFSGGIFPTIYANVASKPEPYVQLASWANGFLPQCYFSVWSSPTHKGQQMTAQEAIAYLSPQWGALSGQVMVALGKPLPALYPILSLGNSLSADEIVSWLARMGGYHYCGFWYDVPYGPYAASVSAHLTSVSSWPVATPLPPPPTLTTTTQPSSSPLPPPPAAVSQHGALSGMDAPSSTSTKEGPPPMSSPPPPPPPPPASPPFHLPIEAPPLSYPHLDEGMVRFLWSMHLHEEMAWNPPSAIQTEWTALLAYRPDIWLGSPMEQETSGTIAGEQATWITFESGRRIVYFPRTGETVLF